MWEESLGTQAGVHLIEGVCLIRGPLNTGFAVDPTSKHQLFTLGQEPMAGHRILNNEL